MEPVILSSDDEEPGFGGELDWWAGLLSDVDDNESDEVVVVGEVNYAKRKSTSLKSAAMDEEDDCVVLDGDPNRPASVENEVSGGSDELLIVGEKGQVACRDYPHPRHLCAKHPFSSTPHDRHCDQCHCYVCDSLAPCLRWGTGISRTDHCHATDKEGIWKTERKHFKLEKNPPLTALKSPDNSLPVALPQSQGAQPLDIIRLPPKSMPQNEVARPAIIRSCSNLTNYSLPNIISHGRSEQSASALARNRFNPQHLLGVRSNVNNPRDRAVGVGALGPQFFPSHSIFKRTGTVRGALPTQPSVYGSSNKVNCAQAAECTGNATPTELSNDRGLLRWQSVPPSANLESYRPQESSQANLDSFIVSSVTSQPQLYSQVIAQPNDGETFGHNGYQSQNTNQSTYQNGNESLQEEQQGNQSQCVSDPPFTDFNFSWPCPSGQSNRQFPSQDSQVQNGEPYPIEGFNSPPTARFHPSQSSQQPELCQRPNLCQTNQEPRSENLQVEGTGSIFEPTSIKETSNQFAGSISLSPADLDFEPWFLENQSIPDGSVPNENIFSTQASSIDAGMLMFDFETSWNGLAHA